MIAMKRVWVADDEKSIRWVLDKALTKEGLDVTCFNSAEDLLETFKTEKPEVIISDIRMHGMDGLALLAEIKQTCPDLPVIIMTAHSDLDSAVSSIQGGAFEYIPKPFEVDEAVSVVKRALANSQDRHQGLTEQEDDPSNEMIGKAPAMQEVFRAIGRLSRSHVTVLINGQSGTGKELVAQHEFLNLASFNVRIRCVQLRFLPKLQDLFRIDYRRCLQKLRLAIYTSMLLEK